MLQDKVSEVALSDDTQLILASSHNAQDVSLTSQEHANNPTMKQEPSLFKIRLLSGTSESKRILISETEDNLKPLDHFVTPMLTHGWSQSQSLVSLTAFQALNSHSQLLQLVVIQPETIVDPSVQMMHALYQDLCAATQTISEMLAQQGLLTQEQCDDIDMIIKKRYDSADMSIIRWLSYNLQALWKTRSDSYPMHSLQTSASYGSSSRGIGWY